MVVDQTSATPAVSAPAQPDAASQRSDAESSPTPPGFGARGRVRRRARFLRKARELAYRDLGGLVYSLHRFAQRNDSLVLAKLGTLSRIDAELRALEASLSERQPVTVLREAGITACPRCAAIHSGEDRFCPNCGLPMSRNVDLPIAGAATAMPPAGVSATPASPPQTPPPAAAPGPATQVTAAPPASAAQAASAAPAPATPAPIATPASPSPAGVVSQPLSGVPSSAAAAAAPPGSPGQPIAPTQTHAAVPPAGGALGRSPVPPAAAGSPSPPGDEDQPTEIIRPPATGS
jgi:hypothetical protein